MAQGGQSAYLCIMQTTRADPEAHCPPREQQVEAFGRALDELRAEIEAELGAKDLEHISRLRRLSRRLEIVGRGLLHFSIEPIGFGAGALSLGIHKSLELMEIGHTVLHGAYDSLSADEELHAVKFSWKSPIDETSWRSSHNVRHHQYTGVVGRDPDIDFGPLRLSPRLPYRLSHRLQPVTNVLTWFTFATTINIHSTGMVDIYVRGLSSKPNVLHDRKPETLRAAKRRFLSKLVRYYGMEFVFYPLLAGPFWWKVALGNLLSDVGRDLCAGAIIYCGHVGTTDYPEGAEASSRGHWYAMQVESARDVELPTLLSILCGGLDKQIEHHLFPRLPPNRLREIAPRVKELCQQHGVHHRSASWPETLLDVFRELRSMSRPLAAGVA